MNVFDDDYSFSIATILICSILFILVSLNLRNGYVTHFDHAILGWFHKIKSPFLDHFFSGVTWLGSLWVLLPLYIMLVIVFSEMFPNIEKFIGIGFWGSVLTVYSLKYFIDRPRPHLFSPFNEIPIDPSFPSAHTTQIVAFSLLLWLMICTITSLHTWLLAMILLLIPVLVGISRIYLQVHYPSDVFAGILIALIWVNISYIVSKIGGNT